MMANPSWSLNHQFQVPSSFNRANTYNPSNGITGYERNCSLSHNRGVSTEWSPEEQAILVDGLKRFAGDPRLLIYAKISMQLPNKTVRDVALRSRWTNNKEINKRRKDANIANKVKDKKERVNDSPANASHHEGHSDISPYGAPLDLMDYHSFSAIGGLSGELLEKNALAFRKVTENISTLEVLAKSQPIYESHPLVQENFALLSQIKENMNRIMIDMNEMPEIMDQMPPLPVRMGEGVANAALLPPNVSPPDDRC